MIPHQHISVTSVSRMTALRGWSHKGGAFVTEVEYEPTEIEYLEMLMDDFDLTEKDTIGDLIDALENDGAEENEP
jgi:hypothetical protein